MTQRLKFDKNASLVGLSSEEAAKKLKEEGFNELPTAERRQLYRIVGEILREPMVFLLVGCGVIYLVLGDPTEASLLLGFLGLIVAITVYQEQKSERALDALRDLSSPRALVIRDGERRRIPGREVVRGDLLILSEGDRVPADAVILSSLNLFIDESMLTGESVPVLKFSPRQASKDEAACRVFAGTMVVKGSAVAETIQTAGFTELGKIGRVLKKASAEPTKLQIETRSLVKMVALIASGLCLSVAVVFTLSRQDWLGGLLAGLTLAMAILPNELPAVLTIFLALGAWRLAQNRVLARKASAIEALGTASVLCVDKTGTLTYNRMTLKRLYSGESHFDVGEASTLPESFHELVEYGVLAGEKSPTDPMERAIQDTGDKLLSGTEHLHPEWRLVKQYPLSTDLLALSHVWQTVDGKTFPVAAKGAPEAVMDLCHFAKEESDRVTKQVNEMARAGLRVLGVAKAILLKPSLPEKQHDIDFEFLGLLGFQDPIRKEVPAAIDECRRAGVRVVMLTGDHPDTARSIAQEIGLPNPESVVTGDEMNQISDRELREVVGNTHVYARVVPSQKLRLVSALKENGEIVAMTGDGVNDAPALKTAHIGIAMGAKGTDVARESASLVLLDDDFGSIVSAVRMGRRIFRNLQRAVSYLVAVHIPITGISIVPVFFNLPLVLLPVHIAFLHLIIEPACSIAFEAEQDDGSVMLLPPRQTGERLFSGRVLTQTLWQGIGVLAVLTAVYLSTLYRGLGAEDARTLTFTTLIIANIGLILSNRPTSGAKNPALQWVLILSVVFMISVLTISRLRAVFRFSPLHASDIAICLTAGLLCSLWFKITARLRSPR